MKTVTKEHLELDLKQATSSLIELARNICWNKISNNTSYIISEIINDENNFFDKRIKRKKDNDKKTPKTLEQIASELKLIYENLYDINLYVYKSTRAKTIIEIQYYPKSSLEPDFYKTVKNNEPMLHCKIGTPHYRNNETEKFDINWELGGIQYEWNNFWNRLKFKWKYRDRIKETLGKN